MMAHDITPSSGYTYNAMATYGETKGSRPLLGRSPASFINIVAPIGIGSTETGELAVLVSAKSALSATFTMAP